MARLYGPGPGDPPPLVATRDLAGLATTDVDDRPVGSLFGALSEQETGLIRYLDVALSEPPRHVLVPIGHTRIERDPPRPACRLRAATYEDLLVVPEFDVDGSPPDGAYQEEVMAAHGSLFYGARYYAHPAYDHTGLYAGDSPIIRDDDADAEGPALRPLSELGRRASAGLRPLLGATVRDSAGERLGTLAELLVEVAGGVARYAVIELDDLSRPTALPLGFLAEAGDGDGVVTRGLAAEDVRLLPAYDGELTRDHENRLMASLEGRLTGERYFQRPDFRGQNGF